MGKVCRICKVEKSEDSFSRLKGGWLRGNCKACGVAEANKHRQAVYERRAKGMLPPHDDKKVCARCHEEKPASEFQRNKALVCGLTAYCRPCTSFMGRRHRQQSGALYMLRSAKSRARQKGFDFDLAVEDIKIPKVCPVLGIPLVMGDRSNKESAPSLDRIDNARGYTKDNVIVVSKRANTLKSDATLDEMRRLVTFYSRLMGTGR